MLNHKVYFKARLFGERGSDLWCRFKWNRFLIKEPNIEPTSSLIA